MRWLLWSKTGARITEQIGSLNSALRASVVSTEAMNQRRAEFPGRFFLESPDDLASANCVQRD